MSYTIKDSGERKEFGSGMVRDTTEGKIDYLNVRFGPMLRRWAEHLTKGRQKYPDPEPGVPNWTLAEGAEELLRARESAARHFEQWLAGDEDEDHAAAVYFNINLAEYVKGKTASPSEPEWRKARAGEILQNDYRAPQCSIPSPWGSPCLRDLGHDGSHVAL